jgi:hypothetical protein
MAKPLSDIPIHPTVMSSAEGDKIVARAAIEEDRLGNPMPLISRLKSDQLTEIERDYIAETWPRHRKRGRAYVLKVRNALIRMQVERLVAEGISTEAAVSEVAQARGLKRSSVFKIFVESSLVV